jgi:hypothetical protein
VNDVESGAGKSGFLGSGNALDILPQLCDMRVGGLGSFPVLAAKEQGKIIRRVELNVGLVDWSMARQGVHFTKGVTLLDRHVNALLLAKCSFINI